MLKPTVVWCWWCMTVCSQCAHWMGVEWPMMVLALQSITAGNMDEAMRLLDQARRAPLSGPAGGPESLIWSDLRWRIEQEASSHSQGIQQKDSPYTISGFPHACVVSLGTIFRSILFLGKERICIHIYIPPPTVLLAVWCNIMYVV